MPAIVCWVFCVPGTVLGFGIHSQILSQSLVLMSVLGAVLVSKRWWISFPSIYGLTLTLLRQMPALADFLGHPYKSPSLEAKKHISILKTWNLLPYWKLTTWKKSKPKHVMLDWLFSLFPTWIMNWLNPSLSQEIAICSLVFNWCKRGFKKSPLGNNSGVHKNWLAD